MLGSPAGVCRFRTPGRPISSATLGVQVATSQRRCSDQDGARERALVMSDVQQPPRQAHAPVSDPPTASAAMPSVSASVSPEQQRLDQQAYLQHALAVSVIGVWHVDIATGAQWWSPETYQLFGVDPAMPLRVDDFYARVHPEISSGSAPRRPGRSTRARCTTSSIASSRRTGSSSGCTTRLRRACRRRTPTRLVGVVRDISDTRRAEEALRASRGRLQAIVENMPVLMTALDDDGHFVFWNTECERVTGFTAEEVLTDAGFIHRFIPDPLERARMRRRAAARGGLPRLGADHHLQGRHEADHRLVEHLRRVPAAGVVDVGCRRRRHRAQAARGAVPAVAEDGGDRPPRRRHRARLQQPAHRRAGLHRRHARRVCGVASARPALEQVSAPPSAPLP